ncbi:ribosomal maturation YjgA family protein [Fibrella arboris]|uniref:ribosomal maturation YjgA family protein n=1 Tax=Fibrella arboris TaxID=3242486 RepID=UPI003521E3CA
MKRNRVIYTGLTAGALLLGLASRRFGTYLPAFINAYIGDTLWALMVFFGFAFVFSRQPTRAIALLALLFSFGIEISQLYHAPWIDSVRATRLGALVLGFGFLWTDLICYSVGVCIGCLIDQLIRRNQ